MALNVWGGGEKLGGDGGEDAMIRICCMKKSSSIKKNDVRGAEFHKDLLFAYSIMAKI